MTRTVCCLVLVVGVTSSQLDAQSRSPLAPGDRVRLETAALGRVIGRVESVTAEELVFRTESRPIPFTVRLTEISTLDVNRTITRGDSAWSGAKRGALVGATVGAVSLGLQHEQVGEDGASVGGAAALGLVSGGLFGGLIGAAVGAGRAGSSWQRVEPSLLMSEAGSASLSISVAF